MAVIETWLRQDLKGLVTVRPLQGQVFSLDSGGNLIGVKVTKDGKPVTLTGTVTGYCILSDGQTVNVSGSGKSGIQNGNEAYIVLPQLVYSVPGQISIVIKLTNGTTTTTLAACTGYVYRSRTSNEVVPPGTHIPSLAELEDVVRRAEGIEKVNIAQTKTDDILKFTVTDRNGNQTTTVVREPTAKVTKEPGGPYVLTVRDGQGNEDDPKGYKYGETVATIPDVAAEVVDKAYIEAVTDPRVALGNPIRVDDAVKAPLDKMTIKIEPKQDLHGYDHPWVGGAGKNIARLYEQLETKTVNGITFTVNKNSAGEIVSITVKGTATANTDYDLWSRNDASSYLIYGEKNVILSSGMNVNANVAKLMVRVINNEKPSYYRSADTETQVTIPSGAVLNRYYINVENGQTVDAVCYPMIRLATEIDPTYEPYSNICPISGYDAVNINRRAKNLLPKLIKNTTESRGLTATLNDDGSITITGMCTASSNYVIADSTAYPVHLEAGKQYCLFGFSDDYVYADYGLRLQLATTKEPVLSGTVNIYNQTAEPTYFRNDEDLYGFCRIYINTSYAQNKQLPDEGITIRPQVVEVSECPAEEFTYSTNYPVSLSVAEGTVYGGNLTLNRDGSGTIVVDKFQYTFTGTETVALLYSGTENALIRVSNDADGNRFPAKGSGSRTISSHFPLASITSTTTIYGVFVYHSGTNSYPFVMFRFPGVKGMTSDDEALDFFRSEAQEGHPVQVCYKLATPQSIPLTAEQVQMLNGMNCVYADVTGSMEMVYRADKYTSVDDGYSALPLSSVSGNPIIIEDGADGATLNKVVMRLEPEQLGTGTPSPTNVRPIRGQDSACVVRTRKNLFNPVVSVHERSIRLDSGAEAESSTSGYTNAIGGFKPNTEYAIQGTIFGTNQSLRVYFLDAKKDFISRTGIISSLPNTFTTPAGCAFIQLQYVLTVAKFDTIQIEKGSTATEFEPVGGVFPIRFPSEAGTVYGGEITINRDGSGTMTVDRATVEAPLTGWESSLNWSTMLHSTLAPDGLVDAKRSDLIICSHAKSVSNNEAYNVQSNTGVDAICSKGTGGQIRIRLDSEATTPEEYLAYFAAQKAAGTPVTFTYLLATPVTYQLTAPQVTTLLGYNVIYGDGEMQIEYYADPKMYIDGAVVPDVSGAIADTEKTVATRNHADRDIFMIEGKLYRATRVITTGQTITPGINCVETTAETHFAPKVAPMFSGSFGLDMTSIDSAEFINLVVLASMVKTVSIQRSVQRASISKTLTPYESFSLQGPDIALPNNAIIFDDTSKDGMLFTMSAFVDGLSVTGGGNLGYDWRFTRNGRAITTEIIVTNYNIQSQMVSVGGTPQITVYFTYKTFN